MTRGDPPPLPAEIQAQLNLLAALVEHPEPRPGHAMLLELA